MDLLNLLKKDIMLSLQAHHIGTIQSFNATTQKAQITINYPKTYYKKNPQTGLPGLVNEPYPVLIDCPIIILGGGNSSLTFPIQGGETCKAVFRLGEHMDRLVAALATHWEALGR